MIRNKRSRQWVLSLVCVTASCIASHQPFSDEAISLTAQTVRYDYKKGVICYEGNVHATQGQTELTADRMTVFYTPNHQIEKIIATGNLAHYKTLYQGKNSLQAEAKTILYYPLRQKVSLQEHASIAYNQNQFSGPAIFYDIARKVIWSEPQKTSQTKIVLEPIKALIHARK